jgi:FKBP-type peptidyl-prolyl cis-trans isomerase FkpA
MPPRAGSRRLTGVMALAAAMVLASGCSDSSTNPALSFEDVQWASSLGIDPADFTELPAGVWIREDTEGTGPVASDGVQVRMHYRGFLPNGTRFDSSLDEPGREPLGFAVGSPNLIPGFSLGARGMRQGGVRTVLIPPFLGYGVRGQGPIPPNSWLVFELHLVQVVS